MKNKLGAGLLGLLAFAAASSQAAAQSTPFRLCADPANPPLSSRSATDPGLYVELGQQIAITLGRRFQPVWTPRLFANLGQKLNGGQCDGVIGLPEGVHVTGLNTPGSDVVLSKPFLTVGYALVVPQSAGEQSLADLQGKRVAVQFGSPPEQLLAEKQGVDLVTVMSPREAFDAIRAGKADAALVWGPTAGWNNHTDQHDAYKVLPLKDEHLSWRVAIGLPANQPQLRDDVDQALSGLGDTIRQLEVKYGLVAATPVTPAAASPGTAHATAPQAASPGTAPATEPQATSPAESQAKTPGRSQRPPQATPGRASQGDQQGASTFTANQASAGHHLFNDDCSHCHGHDAIVGLEERNLMHLQKRYGDEMNEVFLFTVHHGRPTKGMPNWSGILTGEQFHDILAYLHTIQQP